MLKEYYEAPVTPAPLNLIENLIDGCMVRRRSGPLEAWAVVSSSLAPTLVYILWRTPVGTENGSGK